MEFEEKAGERSPESRWITRMESSLLNFFGKQHEWPRQWDSQGPFRNSYWLRNPNFKAKNLFDYEGNVELTIRPSERTRIDQFKQAFLRDAAASAHFRNPEEAGAAGVALNDGGVSYLAANLRPLCNPELKRQQLAGQAARLREQMVERMTHYYVSDNPELELEKRRIAAQQAAGCLIDCAGEQRFGELLRALQVDSDEMKDIYYRIETRLPDEKRAMSAPTIGAAVDTRKMKALLGLGTPATEATAEAPRKDDAALFAREAVAEWMRDLQDLGGNKTLCDYYRVPETTMAEFVKELINGAQRLKLEDQIEALVREAAGFHMKFEQFVALPARLTANLLNRYVDFLGYDTLPPAQRPTLALEGGPRPVFPPRTVPRGGPQLGDQPSTYDQDYYTDWIRSFLDLVERNVRTRDGAEVDLAANRRLGELLAQVRATPDRPQ